MIFGDAAHQMTPNIDQGGNNSIEDVVLLVNQLHALDREKVHLSVAELEGTFAVYHKEREKEVKKIIALTGNFTLWGSWRSWLGWCIQVWIWPLVGDGFPVSRILSPIIKQKHKVRFPRGEEPAGG